MDAAFLILLMFLASKIIVLLNIDSVSINTIFVFIILICEPLLISVGQTLGQKTLEERSMIQAQPKKVKMIERLVF